MPANFGGALRMYHILRLLAERHDVTLVMYGTDRDRELVQQQFGGMLKRLHVVRPTSFAFYHRRLSQFYAFWSSHSFFWMFGKSPEMQGVIDDIFSREPFDVVLAEFPLTASFDMNTDAVKIVDEHNVEYDNFYRTFKVLRSPVRKVHYYREYKKTRVEELSVCRKMDAIFVTSEKDRGLLEREIQGKPKFVIPNGVDTNYFVPSFDETEEFSLVFTGSMGYVPNSDGIIYFLDEIFPKIKRQLPGTKIYIVGSKPPEDLRRRASHDVIVTGYVDDVRPYVWRSSVYVVPLRMGGGTRLKVLEGLSMRKPIVTTSIGCEGIEVTDGVNVSMADDPEEFAERVVELLTNRQKSDELGANGNELVKSRYDWDIVGSLMDEALTSLVNRRGLKIAAELIAMGRNRRG